jgi:hypothetical protein
MGGFLREEELPNSNSGKALERFIQDFDSFDISSLIGGLSDHIEHSEDVAQYYRIMLEFARLPRSVWREVKVRFVKSVEIAKAREFAQPYRVTFPTSDCTFMISPIPPEVPSTGEDGRRARANGLQAFTYAAKYLAKTSKGVGILVSVDGEYFQIDWCLIDQPWEPDAELDAKLAENSPFRTVSEQYRDSFLFRS